MMEKLLMLIIIQNGDIFEYNYSHDNDRGFMLFMPSSQNIIVRYNISVNDVNHLNSPVNASRLINYTSDHTSNSIYNNTFYVSGKVSSIFQYLNTNQSFAFNATFNNNIVYAAGEVGKFSSKPISKTATFKNNCFYPSTLTKVYGPSGANVSGNLHIDPKFINASVTATPSDFKLQQTSPLLSKAFVMPNNGGLDYFQTPLPATPDIGFAQSKIYLTTK